MSFVTAVHLCCAIPHVALDPEAKQLRRRPPARGSNEPCTTGVPSDWKEGRKRAANIAQSNAEIAKIREDAWNASQDSADRRAREFGELIRGVEMYNDANAPGGTVQLSNLYNNAWRLNDGSYVLTNDASLQPFRDLGIDGQPLEVTR